MTTFVARWPITDPSIPVRDLIAEAAEDVPTLALRAHCRVTGRGRWAVMDARDVPGGGVPSGNVLVYQAPAVAAVRDYHRRLAG